MTRIGILFIAFALVLATAAPSLSMEFKAKGVSQHRVSWADRNFVKGNSDDKFRSASRLRVEIDYIASEALRGVTFFEIGHQNWGSSKEGAALGTDGAVVKVSRAYIDWAIPNTQARVRMGLQPFKLPSFTDISQPILHTDVAGITAAYQFSDNVGATLFWMRPANDNDPENETSKAGAHDAMDFWGLTLPLNFAGVRVVPWAMYGSVGNDSYKNGKDVSTVAAAGMLPLMGNPTLAGATNKINGTAWFAGLAADITLTEPFQVSFDAAYGSVDNGSTTLRGRNFDMKRAGGYAAVEAEYKANSCTPGLLAWYATGDDGNPYNGSERMPSIFPDVYATSYAFDGTYYGGAAQTFGYGISGTWAIMGKVSNISLLPDLSHVVRAVYYRGTNDTQMVREKTIINPQSTQLSMIYLTTADQAIELNVDTTYKVYENLSIYLELGYIRLDMDKNLWEKVGYEANKDNFKCTFSAIYYF